MTYPVIIFGASGYVGSELLRLVAGHPELELEAAVSRTLAGERIASIFPHLHLAYPTACFSDIDARAGTGGPLVLLGAAPHGASAALLDEAIQRFESEGRELHVVDTSADFRLDDLDLYTGIYGEHGSPGRLDQFFCGLPELSPDLEPVPRLLSHPGCFTTCTTLACAPLHRAAWTGERLCVSAITGSTGSGKTPKGATHHPQRHGGVVAYGRTDHRHRFEMSMLLERHAQRPVDFSFVPHSGPFARGIHVTVQARLDERFEKCDVLQEYLAQYEGQPFVSVTGSTPHLKEVVGSNLCRIGVEQAGREVVITAVIDNLVKGAAGGAIQWLNRSLGLPETTGLLAPAIGWN